MKHKSAISYIVGAIGFAIAFVSMSCNVGENPILSIPIMLGILLLWISSRLDDELWEYEEFEEPDKKNVDDDIVYIEYNNKGEERYMN